MNNEILKKMSYGIYAITANINSKPTGCIANSVFQVTNDTIAVSLNHKNYTNLCVAKSGMFAISILGEDINNEVISTFGYQSGSNINKFEKINSIDINNLKIIDGALGYIICKVIDKLETETHTIFLGKIIDGDILNNQKPMTYEYFHRVRKGASPKNAPTYVESNNHTNSVLYKCKICGFIYEGDITKENDNYVCPICKQPKNVFEKM